jgi:hypothetical protein
MPLFRTSPADTPMRPGQSVSYEYLEFNRIRHAAGNFVIAATVKYEASRYWLAEGGTNKHLFQPVNNVFPRSPFLSRLLGQKFIDGAVHFRGPLGEGKMSAAFKFQILRTGNGLMNFQLVFRRRSGIIRAADQQQWRLEGMDSRSHVEMINGDKITVLR